MSQATHSRQSAIHASELQFNITGFSIESVVNAKDSILQVFTGNSAYRGNAQHTGDDANDTNSSNK
jgi:hypothetical protein